MVALLVDSEDAAKEFKLGYLLTGVGTQLMA
jgi:hypothetical protein